MELLNPDYFEPGAKHECLFCAIPLAELKDGLLRPHGNSATVFVGDKKSLFTFNCCGDCALKVVPILKKDRKLLREIFDNNMILQEELFGTAPTKNDCPKARFVASAFSGIEQEKTVKKYISFRKSDVSRPKKNKLSDKQNELRKKRKRRKRRQRKQ